MATEIVLKRVTRTIVVEGASNWVDEILSKSWLQQDTKVLPYGTITELPRLIKVPSIKEDHDATTHS